jgi:tRNA uridine 5-carboxymethylaminomethyl modification enzyme
VRATRAQADRMLYKAAIRRRLENQPNLWLFQQAVDDLMVEGDRVVGAVTQVGIAFRARAVVLTAGTFLDGKIHVGLDNYRPAARATRRPSAVGAPEGAEAAARAPEDRHAAAHRRPQHRLQPCEEQPGDGMPGGRTAVPVFSFMGNAAMHPRQLPCWITHTNERTHDIIRSGFDRSPMFTGKIEGVGPRYCPSVEDKINRFADKDSHQIFLEPEGLTTHEFYPNGISTSLPFDIQYRWCAACGAGERAHPAPGLRHRVRLLRPARAQEQLRDRQIQACSLPARSTAPPATKRRPPRACSPASTPRCSAGEAAWCRAATRPTWACWWTT